MMWTDRVVRVAVVVVSTLLGSCDSGAIQLEPGNIDNIVQSNDLVFVNFYADWCRFSNMLAPIWDQTADRVAAEFPDKKVVIGKVDCDKESELGGRYHITKYPTLKYIQNGVLAKREYRGQRSVDSFLEFVRERVKDPIAMLGSPDQVRGLSDKQRHLVGYFRAADTHEYAQFSKMAALLKEDCSFHAGVGEAFAAAAGEAGARLVFRANMKREAAARAEEEFGGSWGDYDTLHTWAAEKCSPLVREITFENAEELTEEGLPFLILFHHPDDQNSVRQYADLVSKVSSILIYPRYFVDIVCIYPTTNINET